MFTSIFIISLSFIWLLIETKFLTIRLPVGKINKQTLLLPIGQPILQIEQTCSLTKFETNRYKAKSYYEHKEFEIIYAKYLSQEQHQHEIEFAQTELERLQHYCPICDITNYDDTFKVTQQTFTIGKSKFTIRACFDCMCKRIDDVWKVQNERRKPVEYKPDSKPSGKRFYEFDESEYPHTIELIIDGNKSITVNGNYKAGMIKDFIKSDRKIKSGV